mmetsp:Transcript_76171/g.149438  ORF Transcript_76171/g.149438 Transcript_76171/m.149438 type:complete len:534 (+) Transcript_76171:61-1662(+)
MELFVNSTLSSKFTDIQRSLEVYNVVREMVDDIEMWDMENNLSRATKHLALTQSLNDAIITKMEALQERNSTLTTELAKLKEGATKTREIFIQDIGYFLSENKQTQKLKDKITEMENRLNSYALYGTDCIEEEEKNEDGESGEATEANSDTTEKVDDSAPLSSVVSLPAIASLAVEEKREQQMFLYDLDDEFLLNVFSYLDTVEVLSVASMCKYSFKRVVALFAIDSAVLQPEWGIRPDQKALLASQKEQSVHSDTPTAAGTAPDNNNNVPSTPDRSVMKVSTTVPATPESKVVSAVSTAPAQEGPGLTKEIIDVLIKKLTPAELMVIMSVAEKLKKQTAKVNALSAEKEDLTARLENTESVRNFLIEKLKSAETEIKNLMAASSALKKQGISDQEIIGYLDLRVNELEGQKAEYAMRCQQLQASLDLQFGSHTHKEQLLSTELNEYKVKYETLDVNFKTQKKVLIKEVKTLRAQVEALTNERNVQANQFRVLREALGVTTAAGASSAHSAGAAGASSNSGNSSGGGFHRNQK